MQEKQTMNAKNLKERLAGSSDLHVIDLRDPDSYLKGHIPGALNIPIKRLETGPAYVPDDRPVVLYGVDHPLDTVYEESLRILRDRGIKIMELEGGLKAWTDAGFPLERENNKLYDDIARRPEQDEDASIGSANKDQ